MLSDNKKIIIFSDRIPQMEHLKNEIDTNKDKTKYRTFILRATYFNNAKTNQENIKTANIIIVSYHIANKIFHEVDIFRMFDTIIFASPQNHISPIVSYMEKYKLNHIVDIIDEKHDILSKLSNKRKNDYKALGWNVE